MTMMTVQNRIKSAKQMTATISPTSTMAAKQRLGGQRNEESLRGAFRSRCRTLLHGLVCCTREFLSLIVHPGYWISFGFIPSPQFRNRTFDPRAVIFGASQEAVKQASDCNEGTGVIIFGPCDRPAALGHRKHNGTQLCANYCPGFYFRLLGGKL